MKRSEFQDYSCARSGPVAALDRERDDSVVKAWLIEEAEEHERLAAGLTLVRDTGQAIEPLADAS